MPYVWTVQAGGYDNFAISLQSAGCIHNLQLPPGQRITTNWRIYRTNWMILQRSSVAQAEIRKHELEKLSLPGAFCIRSYCPDNATFCNSYLWFVTAPLVTVSESTAEQWEGL